MADASHLLSVRNLSVDFESATGTVSAVRNVSWHVDRGETLAILGESGSGKSVTAEAVLGLISTPPGIIRSGEILYAGRDLLKITPEARRLINGRRIAMIFQDPLTALNPVYAVGWQIGEAIRVHGGSPSDAHRQAIRLLDRVGIPNASTRAKDYPHQFSGGQRQRVMIAMAIALNPELLIADEPTTALDVTVQSQILKLIKTLQAENGMGVVMITHDLGVVAEVADRVVVMKDGQVVETGETEAVFKAPTAPYTRQLLAAVPGRLPFRESPPPTEPPLLAVKDLVKHYDLSGGILGTGRGVIKALDRVSFELRRGETLGIVGESGSGKTTLARTLLGLARPTSGTALFDGKPMFDLGGKALFEMRSRIQVVFQDPTSSLNPRMTVEQIISEPWAIHPGSLPRNKWRARVIELLEQVGLRPDHARRYPYQFSGGQRQRIAIARAIALQPELILCDEAVSALDVSVQAQVIELLKSLQRQYGVSYVFIAHDLPVVRDFANRVLVMHGGRIVEQGATRSVFTEPAAAYTRELLSASPVLDPKYRREYPVMGETLDNR